MPIASTTVHFLHWSLCPVNMAKHDDYRETSDPVPVKLAVQILSSDQLSMKGVFPNPIWLFVWPTGRSGQGRRVLHLGKDVESDSLDIVDVTRDAEQCFHTADSDEGLPGAPQDYFQFREYELGVLNRVQRKLLQLYAEQAALLYLRGHWDHRHQEWVQRTLKNCASSGLVSSSVVEGCIAAGKAQNTVGECFLFVEPICAETDRSASRHEFAERVSATRFGSTHTAQRVPMA